VGLTVQPLGARVERVDVAEPFGHVEALVVRTRVIGRRKTIAADSIVAVEPLAGRLLLTEDARPVDRAGRAPRAASVSLARAARPVGLSLARSARALGVSLARAARVAYAATMATVAWLRPRAARTGNAAAQHVRLAFAVTVAGVAWLGPRVADRVHTLALSAARMLQVAGLVIGRAAPRAAYVGKRVVADAAEVYRSARGDPFRR
jgi:hypothetical protein